MKLMCSFIYDVLDHDGNCIESDELTFEVSIKNDRLVDAQTGQSAVEFMWQLMRDSYKPEAGEDAFQIVSHSIFTVPN